MHTPHAVRNTLNQEAKKWLTDSEVLKYEAILINKDDLKLVTDKHLNPAQFLSRDSVEELVDDWLKIINYQTKVREDLTDQPLQGGEQLYIAGSSGVIQGK